jgi:hypothetical protein
MILKHIILMTPMNYHNIIINYLVYPVYVYIYHKIVLKWFYIWTMLFKILMIHNIQLLNFNMNTNYVNTSSNIFMSNNNIIYVH